MATEMIRLHIEETCGGILKVRLAGDRVLIAGMTVVVATGDLHIPYGTTYRNGSSGRQGIAYSPLPSEP